MHKKAILIFALLAGAIFAGQYTSYCLDQTDPCFKSNCYKVNGNWEANPSTGKSDCMYDTSAYSDAQIDSAFAQCIAESGKCEQAMEAGGAYAYPGSSSSGSSSGSFCGPAFVLLGVAGIAGYASMKKTR